MKKLLFICAAVIALIIVGCISRNPVNSPDPPENKEQIRTEEEDTRDSVPPGHHPENDDDDPYGGKYDPIWLH